MKRALLAVFSLLVIAACGGGGGGTNNPPASPVTIFVTLSPLAQINIDAGQSVKLTATVENDSSAKGVTWSVSTAGLTGQACGTLTNATSSGATYNAPGSVSTNLTITVTATSIADATKSNSARVAVSPPPGITTTTLNHATLNSNYSATLQATGGVAPLTWFVASGAFPAGLSLSGSGAITGTPTASGDFTFTVQVADSTTASEGGPATAQALLSLTVLAGVSIATTSLPAGTVGSVYLAQLDASGGTPPYTWSVTAVQLPSGLTLQPGSGVISGTPTSQGSTNFTVAVKDSSPTPQTANQALTLVIGAEGPMAIVTSILTNATPNTNYSAILQARGGMAPLTWSLVSGALPTGLSLASSGAITGDPTVPGEYTFAVQVADACPAEQGGPATAQAQLSLTVVSQVDITTTSLSAGAQGAAYLEQIEASGGTPPYTWEVAAGSLPPGLSLQPTSGAISGTPTSPGNFTFRIESTDSSPTPQSATKTLALIIGSPATLAITTSALLDGTLDSPYNAVVTATGGTPPYRWNIAAGAPPSGMLLNATTGAISGTPASTGTANFTVQVTDSSSTPQTQTQTLNLTVNDAGEACTSSGNDVVLNGSYAFSLSGFNDIGFVTVVGSFTADGTGRITAGEADANGVLGAQRGNIINTASAYSVGPDHRGCATLATPFGTFTAHFELGSISSNIATAGRMIEWDSPGSSAFIAAGQLLRQTYSSFANGLSGSYAFRTIGWDPSAQGGREVCVGVLSAGGNTLSGMEQDCNDAWNIISTATPAVSGTYSTLDANGRGTGIITLGGANSNVVFYAVSSSQLLVVNADPGPFASGEWDQQVVPAGGAGFTQASLKGNMVFHLNGLSLGGTASAVSLETSTADGINLLAIKFYADRAGAMQVSSTLTCTYSVEPSGRVFLSSDTQSCGSNTPVLYLTGVNAGFIMDAAPGVDTGSIEPQSAGPFSNASLKGNFSGGIDEVVIQSAQAELDPVSLDGSGSMSGVADIGSMNSQDTGALFPTAIYSVNSDGTFSLSSSGGAVVGVIISDKKFVMFSPLTLPTPLPTLLVMQK